MNRWLVDGVEVVMGGSVGLVEATGYVHRILRGNPAVKRVTIIPASCGMVEICSEEDPAPFYQYERNANKGGAF